jgi:hypothetical protein
MRPSTRSVDLTVDELLCLDGHCSSAVQIVVDKAKHQRRLEGEGLATHLAMFVSDVVHEATTKGRLGYRSESVPYCPTCLKGGGYAIHKRTSSRGYKGKPDYDRPLYLSAIDLAAPAFIRVQNRVGVGCCYPCLNEVLPVLRRELSTVRAYLPEALMGTASKYAYHERCKCKLCGWEGHRGLLRNDGEDFSQVNYNYPAGCPACVDHDARRKGMANIEAVDGFVVVDV